jgi:signal peptidase I
MNIGYRVFVVNEDNTIIHISQQSFNDFYLRHRSSLQRFSGCTSETFVAESPSMEPTIARGRKVKVDLSAYSNVAPVRFDIVVFRPPTNKGHVFMFRVLALPGEHIELGDSMVKINGTSLSIPGQIVYSSLASGHPATYRNLELRKDDEYSCWR